MILLSQSNIFEETHLAKSRICKELGIRHSIIELGAQYESADDLVFPHGGISFVQLLKPMVNGVFWSKNLDYNIYSSYWRDLMLNQDGLYLTFAQFIKDPPFDIFGEEFFARPNANNKIFSGQRFRRKNFVADLDIAFRSGQPELDCLIYCSSSKIIEAEYRFAVVDKKIVATSRYNTGGLSDIRAGCDNPDAILLADEIANLSWQPDVMYCLDIAIWNGKPHVLEIGSINTCGWYAMDIKNIISAIKDWNRRYQGFREAFAFMKKMDAFEERSSKVSILVGGEK